MITALIDLMGTYHQAGNLVQMAAIARSILTAIPEDVVALQFLGLALYQMGRIDAAREVFSRVAAMPAMRRAARWPTTGELAADTVFREATRPAAGLGDAWHRVAQALLSFGFRRAAARAYRASRLARNPAGPVSAGALSPD